MSDVDLSFELGGGWNTPHRAMTCLPNCVTAVVGHESFVAEVGSDVYYRPTDQLTFKAGPRILLGDDDYASTYFGVSADESAGQ